jgi:hypothetical protein
MLIEQQDIVCRLYPEADRAFHRQADGLAQRARFGYEMEASDE